MIVYVRVSESVFVCVWGGVCICTCTYTHIHVHADVHDHPKKNYWGWGVRCAEKLDQLGDVDFPLTMAREFFGGGAKLA